MSYVVPDVMRLADRWDEQILTKRTRAEVKAAADGGCLKSQIQLDHLDRNVAGDD
jgi:hypothetical protein